MRFFWGAALAAGIWWSTAGAAIALVQDPVNALTASQEQALQAELGQLGANRFDVVVVDRAPGGVVTLAQRSFQQLGLGPTDGVIAVSMADRQVGVHLGQEFAARGVDGRAIETRVAQDFAPLARQGDLPGAIAALAQGLVAEGAGPTGANRAPGLRRESESVGFPWWLVAVPLAAGAFFLMRRNKGGGARRRSGQDLGGLLADLRARHGRMINGALSLDEASSLGKFAQGTTARTYQTLGSRSAALLAAASDFGNRLDAAEADLQGHRTEAAATAMAQLQQEAPPLEAEIAAAVTAMNAMGDDAEEAKVTLADARRRLNGLVSAGHEPDIRPMLEERLDQGDRLLAEHDPTGALAAGEEVHGYLDKLEGRVARIPAPVWAELPGNAEGLARRVQEIQAVYANDKARAESYDLAGDPVVEGRLAEAYRALTTPPVDHEAARARLNEAQEALTRYHEGIERVVEREAQRQPAAGFGSMLPPVMPPVGWMPGPIIVMNDYDHGYHPGGGMSAGGSWGGGGLSGGGSWGGGDGGSSGGGSW